MTHTGTQKRREKGERREGRRGRRKTIHSAQRERWLSVDMNGQVRGLLQPLGVVRVLPTQQPCAPDPPSTEVLCSGIPSPGAWTNLGQLGEGLAGFSQMQVSRGNDQGVCGGSKESQGMAHPDGIVHPLPPPPERALLTAPRPSSSFRPASDFSALDRLRSPPPHFYENALR